VLTRFRSLARRSGVDAGTAWRMIATLAAASVIPVGGAEN
jgi:hypothetical protein